MRLSRSALTPRRQRTDWAGIGLWVSLVVTSVLWLLPFAVILSTSVKTKPDLYSSLPWDPPVTWAWDNYLRAIDVGDFWAAAGNSLTVAAFKVPIGIFIAAITAYALARIRPRGARLAVAIIAIGSMVPVQVAIGPLFTLILQIGLLDTKLGLILPYLAFGIPFQVFMLYGFFRAIPSELEESALMDGASRWRIFWQICIPLAMPALAALIILDFVGTWNEYALAVALIQGQANETIPLAVQAFTTQFDSDQGAMTAFYVISSIPVLIVYLMFQRYFVSGAFAGAIKG